jgi:glucosamine--fructose-6-phosphate aminotransferase (isomerizing)
MCGIVGYIGKRKASSILLSSLKRLEYRGYDSYGFCIFNKDKPHLFKKIGKISETEKEFTKLRVSGNVGIAHSRWATTGNVTKENAHPHTDCYGDIFIVHNGIIENYKELKEKLLEEGHQFSSETDTEVIAHLIEKFFDNNLEEAVIKSLKLIKGAYALAVLSKKDPQKIVVARNSSPLLIGLGEDEYIIASDPVAVMSRTKKVIYLEDEEVGVLTPKSLDITDINKIPKEKVVKEIEWDLKEAQKGGYDHFMLKEIMEEPETIENALRGRLVSGEGLVKLGGLDNVFQQLKNIDNLILIGCGTSYFAAQTAKYWIEEIAGISCQVGLGSELRYRNPVIKKGTAAIFISQSGETADTLACLREFRRKNILCLGITNVVGSSQARETEAGIYTRSGPEIAVASTKAFLGQLSILALLAIYLGRMRGLGILEGEKLVKKIRELPNLARKILEESSEIKKIAEQYKDFKNFFFIGRKYNSFIASEGALKLKEISYLHAEGLPGGEIKHGPLALVDKNFPTIALCPKGSVYEKMISNIEEVKVRGGPIIAIATEGDENIKEIADHVIYIPETIELFSPILSVIPLHLFAYYMAFILEYNIDKPRNLAKSVTVE